MLFACGARQRQSWLKLKSEVLETRSVFSVVGMLDYPSAKKRAGGGVNPHQDGGFTPDLTHS